MLFLLFCTYLLRVDEHKCTENLHGLTLHGCVPHQQMFMLEMFSRAYSTQVEYAFILMALTINPGAR